MQQDPRRTGVGGSERDRLRTVDLCGRVVELDKAANGTFALFKNDVTSFDAQVVFSDVEVRATPQLDGWNSMLTSHQPKSAK